MYHAAVPFCCTVLLCHAGYDTAPHTLVMTQVLNSACIDLQRKKKKLVTSAVAG
jgi:hypothetical protein